MTARTAQPNAQPGPPRLAVTPSDRALRVVAAAGGRQRRAVVEHRLNKPADPLAGVAAVGLAIMRGALEVDDPDVVLVEQPVAA